MSLIDDRLPFFSYSPRYDEFHPQVDQESAVYDVEKVGGGAFAQYDFVGQGSLAALPQVE